MKFEFATANRIIFGPRRFGEIGDIALSFGRRAFVVTGRRALSESGVVKRLKQILAGKEIEFLQFSISSEPDVTNVDLGVSKALKGDCDLVIALGGGSVIDTGKAIGGLLTNGGSVMDYMEVVGRGQPLTKPSSPLIAVPTTAGTGSEVTRNAVLKYPKSQVKASFRSLYLLPRVALVDAELTYSLPSEVTASTGLDALTQLLEPYTSKRAQPLTNALCLEGIRRVARSLVSAFEHGEDPSAREDMALASLFSGLALANSDLGAVHGFAAPLGGRYPIPHGIACACLLPHVIEANIRSLQSREPSNPILHRYGDIAECLLGKRLEREHETIEAGIRFIHELCDRLKIPSLAHFGVKESDIPEIARKAANSSSMKSNPVAFSQEELENILAAALG